MSTLRQALGQIEPHVSLKTAWKLVIQSSRRLRKQGHATLLHERAAVERLLALEPVPEMDIVALKVALQHLVQSADPGIEDTHALTIEAWAASCSITLARGDVELHIHHPNELITVLELDRWLATQDGRITLDAQVAATWIHHLGGLRLGGAPLRVEATLGSGLILPPVQRDKRGRERPHERRAWLPHLDTEGHFSATPHSVAKRHGYLLSEPGRMVIDPFCGAGGDAIAAAQFGARVSAGDQDSGRLALAQQNALHFGVQNQVEFQCVDAIQHLRESLNSHPGSTVFLDPPWGGVNWDREGMNWEALFGPWPELVQLLTSAGRIVLKLPRTFDLCTLDTLGRTWSIELGLGPCSDGNVDFPRCLTAISG